MSVIWLASYPKSGNTWLRAVLDSYLRDGEPVSINRLIGARRSVSRGEFDEMLGLPSSDLTQEETLSLRALLNRLIVEEASVLTFIKVHDAFVRTPAGPLFPEAGTARAVCLVRNPLDVAVSYAHHLNGSIDHAVSKMNGDKPESQARGIYLVLPERIGSWSANVSSWMGANLPVHVARYEDLAANPAEAFGAIVRFVGLDWCPLRLARAVDCARFERLKRQEEQEGFHEKQPTASSFFRSGRPGGWRTALTGKQVRSLVAAHGPVMDRFGYLREANSFLADLESGAGAG